MNNSEFTLSATTIMSDKVKNYEGQDLGSVKDLMITESGKVTYLVLSFGGIFGVGDKLFAVPWDCVCIDTKTKTLRIDADKEFLKEAPGFDKDLWPEAGSDYWKHEVEKFYQSLRGKQKKEKVK